MFISRICLDVSRPGAARLASSPYRMHAAVESCFPKGQSGAGTGADEGGRILWRLDSQAENRQLLKLYIVSPQRPDLSRIAEQVGCESSDCEMRDYEPLLRMVATGQAWAFRLKANTVRKVLVDKGRRQREGVVGTLQGHVTPPQKADWFVQRMGTHGFSLAFPPDEGGLVITRSQTERFRRGKAAVTLSTAVFDGILQVEDAGLFRDALCKGIGRAKGFGCGLLTIAPPAHSDVVASRRNIGER